VLVVVCVAVVLVVTSLQHGLSGLLAIRWRHRWLLPLSLVIQTVVVDVPALPAGLARVVHVLSYVLAGLIPDAQVRIFADASTNGIANTVVCRNSCSVGSRTSAHLPRTICSDNANSAAFFSSKSSTSVARPKITTDR